MKMITHAALVNRAERWLRAGATIPNYRGAPERVRCAVVLTERMGGSECPDAIGWARHSCVSVLIECKASRSDFLADRDKYFRDPDRQRHGMGRYRYYMTPRRLIKPEELPLGWGLIEVSPYRSFLVRMAAEQPEYARYFEMHLMWSELTRYQLAWRGEAVWSSKAKATVEATVAHCKQVEAMEQRRIPFKLKRRHRVNSVH